MRNIGSPVRKELRGFPLLVLGLDYCC